MSNFKEIYPQRDFIENLHRMYSIGTDDYMTWAYNGKVNEAPLTADYVYQLEKHTDTISGKELYITDAIHMPLESFTLYGDTTQTTAPTMNSKVVIHSVGTYNNSNQKWETVCKNDMNTNPIKNDYKETKGTIISSQPLSKLQNGVRDYYKDGYLYFATVYDKMRDTDNWQIDDIYSNNVVTVISLFLPNGVTNSTDIWCTHFKSSEKLDKPNKIKIENQRMYITADATKYPDLDSFLNWMKKNEVIVCYQRKNIIKVPMEPYVLLYTYDELTKIVNDQNAEMEVEFRIAPNAKLWQRQTNGSFKEITL